MTVPIMAIGLMSGTSMDGIDVAQIVTNGHTVSEWGRSITVPYPDAFSGALKAAVAAGQDLSATDEAALEEHLTHLHAEAIKQFEPPDQVSLIGFHGHTLWHRPDLALTKQVGNGPLLAELTGIDVVSNFRSADMKAGGQGAPFAPLYHAALAKQLAGPLAVLNLGGVGNITYFTNNYISAFDTGPGNALIDDWVQAKTGQPWDKDGLLSSAGNADEALVRQWLNLPYFNEPPPKSLDRNDFTLEGLDQLNINDGAATLTAFTAHSVLASIAHLPFPPKRWLVTGGGRHNPTLMAMLSTLLKSSVEPVENVGWDGDALEAQAFGFLAVRSRLGLPLSVPGTTGVEQPTTGGVFHPAPEHARRN